MMPFRNTNLRFSVAEQIRYSFAEERKKLILAVKDLSEAMTREAIELNGWSVHDILAHRLFWERREVEALTQYLYGQRIELLDFPIRYIDGANRGAVKALDSQSTKRIIGKLISTRDELNGLVVEIEDVALNQRDDNARAVLGVAIEHDREHCTQILQWRQENLLS